MLCKICNSPKLKFVYELPWQVASRSVVSKISRCPMCGTFCRDWDTLPQSLLQEHFDLACYTQPQNKQSFLNRRADFFQALFDLVGSYIQQTSLLDVGCAYGHMMDTFANNGFKVTGVEIVNELRNHLNSKGYEVYKYLSDLPKDSSFDAITFIDSLYYFEDPLQALYEARSHLKSNGVLVLRITNRTTLLNLYDLLGLKIQNSLYGDSLWNFSYRGIKLLCQKAGFTIDKLLLDEKGKKVPFKKKMFYKGTFLLSKLTGLKLTPGIILVCKLA